MVSGSEKKKKDKRKKNLASSFLPLLLPFLTWSSSADGAAPRSSSSRGRDSTGLISASGICFCVCARFRGGGGGQSPACLFVFFFLLLLPLLAAKKARSTFLQPFSAPFTAAVRALFIFLMMHRVESRHDQLEARAGDGSERGGKGGRAAQKGK